MSVRGATFESRVRGLLLGLALGDAIGSKQSDIPTEGLLPAGAATQLAAWTSEGLLRTATRYGGYVIGNPVDVIRYAYQRWAVVRGDASAAVHDGWYPFIDLPGKDCRGWLSQVPAMAQPRGSSPATLGALASGKATGSAGCQALLRSLPVAAYAIQSGVDAAEAHARVAAGMTHGHARGLDATGFAVRIAAECLRAETFQTAFDAALHDGAGPGFTTRIDDLIEAMDQPCLPDLLERLAPDRTGAAALAGGIYVALSFPDRDTIAEAIEFAGWAPDGDSVAAVAGVLLGAVHGFEALPVPLVSRLEIGWVMDTLARDLVVQIQRNQAGDGWKGDGYEDPLDPYWEVKYPGV